ncbi:hypothetical protein D0Y65_019334 [Glycine soja]|uniref:Uncharacterized protein n=1 Tax=Glycine soja TaxID=3848 RepID=A0A445J8J2_GLYSO|nr:hypothetical protein D0Y65_019334 [Glycine soja]
MNDRVRHAPAAEVANRDRHHTFNTLQSPIICAAPHPIKIEDTALRVFRAWDNQLLCSFLLSLLLLQRSDLGVLIIGIL